MSTIETTNISRTRAGQNGTFIATAVRHFLSSRRRFAAEYALRCISCSSCPLWYEHLPCVIVLAMLVFATTPSPYCVKHTWIHTYINIYIYLCRCDMVHPWVCVRTLTAPIFAARPPFHSAVRLVRATINHTYFFEISLISKSFTFGTAWTKIQIISDNMPPSSS